MRSRLHILSKIFSGLLTVSVLFLSLHVSGKPDAIGEDQMKLIINYLQNTNELAEISSPLEDATPAEIFRVRCSACHPLERVIKLIGADKTADASRVHIVSRMQSKAPEWITPEEAELLLTYIESLENKNEIP